MMRNALALVAALSLSGCIGGGLSQEQAADIRAHHAQDMALAKAHKITFVEAAARENALISAASKNSMADGQALLNAYRSALASQVDAGQMTPEVAEYQMEQKAAQSMEADRQRINSAFQQMAADHARAIDESHAQMQTQQLINAANRPRDCVTSAGFGTLNTHCQ